MFLNKLLNQMSNYAIVAFSLFFLSTRGNDFVLTRCSEAELNKWSPDPGHTIRLDSKLFRNNNGFWFKENPSHFFDVPSYRFV